jgi:hypothetical protein
MLWWIKVSVSCSNLFVVVTCEHADSASSSTRLQVMGGDEEPRELGKYSSDTPGPTRGPGATLPKTQAPVSRTTKSCDRFSTLSPGEGLAGEF